MTTRRRYLTIACPSCPPWRRSDLALIVTRGTDQGGWVDVEIDEHAPRDCACEPEPAALTAAVERAREEAA